MKHERDQGKPRRQTKLLQNNGRESLKGGSRVQYERGVAWRGVAPCGARRVVARRGEGRTVKRKGLVAVACVRHPWLCLAAARACVWRRVLVVGSLGALSIAAVAWRGCGLMWMWSAAVAVRTRL